MYREPTVMGRKPGLKSMVWSKRKKETFIQTGRRGGDGQLGREDSRQGSSWRTRVGKAAAGGAGSPTVECR